LHSHDRPGKKEPWAIPIYPLKGNSILHSHDRPGKKEPWAIPIYP